MKHYETSTPRIAFACLAAALTAVTLGLSVVLPARVDTNATPADTMVADAPTRVERIDVIAVRHSNVAATHDRTARREQREELSSYCDASGPAT